MESIRDARVHACGGWCPKGRKAEDGNIDPKYPLKESSSASYLQRTEWNVRDSDATVIFSIAPTLSGGSKKTVDFARKLNKPCLPRSATTETVRCGGLREWPWQARGETAGWLLVTSRERSRLLLDGQDGNAFIRFVKLVGGAV